MNESIGTSLNCQNKGKLLRITLLSLAIVNSQKLQFD